HLFAGDASHGPAPRRDTSRGFDGECRAKSFGAGNLLGQTMASQTMILAVRDVSAGYGTAPVLRNVSFTQQYGEMLGVVGHNGMGKKPLLRTMVGLLQTASGAIEFDGEPIEGLPAYRRSSTGIGYVPQGNLGFPDLSVAENLELARAMKG